MTKSGCVDSNGNSIPNALTFKNNNAIVETDSTCFCYLYFDEKIANVEIKTLVNSLHINNANLAVEKLKNFYGDESGDYAENKSLGYYDLAKVTLSPYKDGEE